MTFQGPVRGRAARSFFAAPALLAPALLALALAAGCGDLFEGDATTAGTGSADEGESCTANDACRPGLSCAAGVCTASGDQQEGEPCSLTRDCDAALYCAANRRCAPAGASAAGSLCDAPAQCARDLYCAPHGITGVCAEHGDGGISDTCATPADCAAGLGCSASGRCAGDEELGGVVPFASPIDCPPVPEETAFRVFFDVPEAVVGDDGLPTGALDVPGADFYRLPFPNDLRVSDDGRVDLRGFAGGEGGAADPVARLVEAIEADGTPIGVHQAVLFRFSVFPDADSIDLEGEEPTLSLVDIDPDSPRFGQRVSLSWTATNGGNAFLCPNWVGLRPFWNQPLAPNTTYAALIRDSLRGPNGEAAVVSPDFTAMLRGTVPEEEHLRAAWERYAPLRDYLVAEGVLPTSLIAASVFTTGDPRPAQPGIARRAAAANVRLLGDLVACDTGVVSPCELAPGVPRTCPPADAAYWELHALASLPVIQEGDAPYAESGGGVLFDDAGVPLQWGSAEVCVSITVPRQLTMPRAGWPVVVYAGDVGEDLRTPITRLGETLVSQAYTSVTFELPAHGGRRAGSPIDPRALFYNLHNPRAFLGNRLQTALDVASIGRLVEELVVPGASSPTGSELRFDTGSLVLLGQGEGASAATIALADAHPYAAAVLSSAGGGLGNYLIEKTAPIDVAGGLAALLPTQSLSDFEPYLNLLQMYLEPADPVNYAPLVLDERPEGLPVAHVVQFFGLDDTYTPPTSAESLARALDLPLASSAPAPWTDETVTLPALGNVTVNGQPVTAAVVQYRPLQGDDGAFVAYEHPTARSQLIAFIEALYLQGTPLVGTGAPVQ
jgi:hypothetical protein